MSTLTITQEFQALVAEINHNVITFVDVTVNGVKETIQLVYKNNLHTKSGKIIIFSDIDTDFQKIKVIREIKFKK